ncbi:MCE family protein [Thermoleophilia bacterium SCSIO 60948]|nr:MCE family protein [Thermoleophilia bacterium SCSIO 60948]
METRSPTLVRILIAIGFTISCFGLALFLWIAFGGGVPLKSEGYRFEVPFDEATQLATESDVRISGVSVGKVKDITLGDEGLADAVIELDAQYAPIPKDTEATLRTKTLLGETYVELSPGDSEGAMLPEGGALPSAQVAESVQLDEVLRAFDEPTRESFQNWMQGTAIAFGGRGQDLSAAIGNLEPFAVEATDTLRLLDSQGVALRGLVRDGGETFDALSERQGQLSGLIQNANQVFATTAARDGEIRALFEALPTFLDESRLTLSRLERFSVDTDPLITQLRPSARQLSPTLVATGDLAPNLTGFLQGLRGSINASRPGFPALRKLLDDDLPPALSRLDPFMREFNPILIGLRDYRREITGLLGNVSSATNAVNTVGSPRYLRTVAPLLPEAMATYPSRLRINRTNAYVQPGGAEEIAKGGFESFLTSNCTSGLEANLPSEAEATGDPDFASRTEFFNNIDGTPFTPEQFYELFRRYSFDDQDSTSALDAPRCKKQAPYRSVGQPKETTDYQHFRRLP